MISTPRITLLSTSARRREIIRHSFNFVSIENSRGEEPRPRQAEPAGEYVVRSAVAKLGPALMDSTGGLLISADTVVVLKGRILGKPVSKDEARRMLTELSDAWHEVITGIAILDPATGSLFTGSEVSQVRTRPFTVHEIEEYVSTSEPYDKAGGYAVQDDEFKPVLKTEGCYLNIVGLPLCSVATLLRRHDPAVELLDLNGIPYYDRCTDCKLGDVAEGQP